MTETANILIVDDEVDVCNFLYRLLSRKGYAVTTATSEAETLATLRRSVFVVAMVDLKLPDTDGLTLLKQIKSHQPYCEVIIMTGFSTVKTAVNAIQLGAYEYVEKPFDDISEIEKLIHNASLQNRRRDTNHHPAEWGNIARSVGLQAGHSKAMQQLLSLSYKIANKNVNVLIQGKTGSGKEVLARFIHAASNRSDQTFFPINCAALPETMLESELFGHERGSFTGAGNLRRGIFELAHRGTLFLDEVGDASPSIQVKLLRVLETGEFMRVGGEKPIRSNVRLISASNVDLRDAVGKKLFREDLYYRLNVVRLELPSLSERHEDIPDLAEYLVQQTNPGLSLDPSVVRLLQDHSWPGNIRELANVLRSAAALCGGATILPEHLGGFLPSNHDITPIESLPLKEVLASSFSSENLSALPQQNLEQLLEKVESLAQTLYQLTGRTSSRLIHSLDLHNTEKETIRYALEHSRGNISDAARLLGIGRNTLYRKISTYDLKIS